MAEYKCALDGPVFTTMAIVYWISIYRLTRLYYNKNH